MYGNNKIGRLINAFLTAGALFISVNGYAGGGDAPFKKLPSAKVPAFAKDTFRIETYGAKADGITLNTKAINQAITACSEKGGGVVFIPRGMWLTGPIVMKSNVNLNLANGAIVQFTADFDQYPLTEGNWEGLPAVRNQSPISGANLENIAITGFGILDGNGDAWRMVKKDKLTETQWKARIASGGVVNEAGRIWYPTEKSLAGSKVKGAGVIAPGKTIKDYEPIKDFLRPNMLVFVQCKKVLLEGVTFQNSPAWNLHPLMCEELTLRNIYVKNPWYAQNGDGVDIESCKNVVIENSVFDVGDDGICIKSGRDEAGRKRGMPTENVLVSGCTVYHAHGGFVIGSEMSGGAKNIYVIDCSFIGTDIGLRFKTTRGRGGIVEKIYAKNISMKDIVGEAILFDMYYEAKDPVPLAGENRVAPKVVTIPVTEATPQFRDFIISDITCLGAEKGIFVRGLPEMNIQNISLSNMNLVAKKGIEITEAQNIRIKNVNIITAEKEALVKIHNASKLEFDDIRYSGNEKVFAITGEKSKNIRSQRTAKAKAASSFGDGASEQVLTIE